jgi:hypothetical protein
LDLMDRHFLVLVEVVPVLLVVMVLLQVGV